VHVAALPHRVVAEVLALPGRRRRCRRTLPFLQRAHTRFHPRSRTSDSSSSNLIMNETHNIISYRGAVQVLDLYRFGTVLRIEYRS
jgi:hypothetical protein